jgi:hypothetical protein
MRLASEATSTADADVRKAFPRHATASVAAADTRVDAVITDRRIANHHGPNEFVEEFTVGQNFLPSSALYHRIPQHQAAQGNFSLFRGHGRA